MRASSAVVVLVALAWGAGACRAAESASRAVPPAAAVPFDVNAVIEQVHFAYRRTGDAFTAGHGSYDVRVVGGAVSVSAVRERSVSAAITIETTSVSRAAAPLSGSVTSARVAGDGSLELTRGAGMVEVLDNSASGIEQSWRMATRPEGTGDLVVRVGVRGQRYVGASDAGLHFVDDSSGLGTRYGLATWIDARGMRTAVVPRWNEGEIVMTVEADVNATWDGFNFLVVWRSEMTLYGGGDLRG